MKLRPEGLSARHLLAPLVPVFLGAGLLGVSCAAENTAGETTRPAAAAVDSDGDGAPDGSGAPSDDTGATLRPGTPVPAPAGKVVLTVSGGPVTNVGDELRLDLAQLEAMGTTELTVDDTEATGRTVTFSGPLVRDVLAVAGVEDATTMHAVALNEYAVDVPVSDATDLPLLLATRADGRRMSVADYGPTRFVYPTEGYDLPRSTYAPRWIWQLEEIVVE